MTKTKKFNFEVPNSFFSRASHRWHDLWKIGEEHGSHKSQEIPRFAHLRPVDFLHRAGRWAIGCVGDRSECFMTGVCLLKSSDRFQSGSYAPSVLDANSSENTRGLVCSLERNPKITSLGNEGTWHHGSQRTREQAEAEGGCRKEEKAEDVRKA